MKTFLIVSLALLTSPAFGINCSIGGAVRCLCPASLSLHCDNNYTGYVRNEETPQQVTLSIMDRSTGGTQSVTVNNPTSGVRSFYGGLDRNPDVLRAMMDAGLRINEDTEIQVQGIQFPDDLTLYNDSDALQAIPQSAQAGYDYACTWEGSPSLVTSPSCGSGGLCSGPVSCIPRGQNQVVDARAACPALPGRRCPSASDCAAAPTTEIMTSPSVGQDGDAEYSPVRGQGVSQ